MNQGEVLLFSVFDVAASRYMDPFPAPTIEFAIRGFRAACENLEHDFNKYPEDYALYFVGSFDPTLGVIVEGTAARIAVATQFGREAPMDRRFQEKGKLEFDIPSEEQA